MNVRPTWYLGLPARIYGVSTDQNIVFWCAHGSAYRYYNLLHQFLWNCNVSFSRECSWPWQFALEYLNSHDDGGSKRYRSCQKQHPLSLYGVVLFSFITSLKSNLRINLNTQNTTCNNCILSLSLSHTHTQHGCTLAKCNFNWNMSVTGHKRLSTAQTTAKVNCKLHSQYLYVIYRTAWHHIPGHSKYSITTTRTSKQTTLCIFLWEVFRINWSPVSLLYLSSVNCQNEFELTGYGPLLHNVSHNSSPLCSIMGHDITVQEPGSDVIEKNSTFVPFKIRTSVPICFYVKPHTSTLGINQEIPPLKNNTDLHNTCYLSTL